MTDHVWAQEQVAAHLAGGLSAEESDRLQRHARECAECAAALAAASHLDRGLGALFAPLRPKPGLEDRAVQRFRAGPTNPTVVLLFGWPGRALRIAAGLILVTTFGALAASIMHGGRLPMPGEDFVQKSESFTSMGSSISPSPASASIPDQSTAVLDDAFRFGVSEHAASTLTSESRPVDGTPTGITSSTTTYGLATKATENFTPPAWGSTPKAPNGGMMGMSGGMMGMGGMGMGGMGMGGMGMMNGGMKPNAYAFFNPHTAIVPPAMGNSTKGVKDLAPEETARDKDGAARSPRDFETFNGQTKPNSGSMQKLDLHGTPPAPSTTPAAPAPAGARRIVIRSGDIEFEIESFDSALATVTKLAVAIKGAYVDTVNSEKLPNGKVRGSVVVRTPPEHLDSLVLDLRKELGKGGELKSVKLASADITKQYTDLESQLRASRAMETRLLAMIKDGKGDIKQLLEAERELGVWRTKIERAEGEIRYYANLAALSTLTITLMEKEIRAAAVVTEKECVDAGVEVENVNKTHQLLLQEILKAKGRVTHSELSQVSAGQYNASLVFEVSPEASGPIRDRLEQLGRVARLKIYTKAEAQAPVSKGAKISRGDTLFNLQLYNLANVAPRETATLQVAVPDVPAAYNALRDAIAKAAGRVHVAQLNEQDKQNVTAQLDFDVKRTAEGSIQTAIAAAGEITARQVGRASESDAVTDTKLLYKVTLFELARIKPRDTVAQQVAVPNVAAAFQTIRDSVTAAKGRVAASQLDENDKHNGSASIDFEIRRTDEAAVKAVLDGAGETVSRQLTHAPANEIATDTKVQYRLKLLPANHLKPRETTTLSLEVPDVDAATALIVAQLNEAKGRPIDAKSGRERNGKANARLVYEVPFAAAASLVERFKNAGSLRALNSTQDPQAPEGKSATARIEVSLANAEGIVAQDDGLWPPVKKGLSYSASVLLTSMTWVVFGLCVVLPWAVLAYAAYRVVRRWNRNNTSSSAPMPTPPANG